MAITQTLSSLGTPPSIDDPLTFETRADALLTTAMPTFVTQMNTVISQANTLETNVNTKESTASTAATTATTQAGIATTQAGTATTQAANAAASAAAADASAAAAAALAGAFTGTSTSSVAIGTGNKTFTTQSGEQYTAGVYLIAVSQANAANFMFGQVVSYAGGSLVLNVQATGGSGTYADWNLSLAGVRGPAGTGITDQATGFTAVGGTSAKTLTVDVDLTASAVATTAGTQTLTNKTLTDPSLADSTLTRAMLKDSGYTYFNSGTTNALNFTNGSHQRWAPNTGSQTLSITNWPPSGNLGELLIEGVNLGAATITWPTINWIKSDGTTTTTFSSNGVTLQASGTDWVFLWTRDAGTTIYGKVVR